VFGDKAGPVEGIRALLDSGNRRGTPVPRAIAQGRGYALVEFDVFCPKATAGIGGLPDTVLDRAIVISMERRSRAEPVERLRESRVRVVAAPLRDALSGHIGEMDGFTVLEAELPEDLDDRAQDGWEPLLAIADAASGHWPRTARQAADAIFREPICCWRHDRGGLLADCRVVFAQRGKLLHSTLDLREALIDLDGSQCETSVRPPPALFRLWPLPLWRRRPLPAPGADVRAIPDSHPDGPPPTAEPP